MKTINIIIIMFLAVVSKGFSQKAGIGTWTPHASSILEIQSSDKGVLFPRIETSNLPFVINPAKGLMTYDPSLGRLMVNMGTPSAPSWKTIADKSGWLLTGNPGTNPLNNFIGNMDDLSLKFRVNNIHAGELNPATGNIFWGLRAGQSNTSGSKNIAIGHDALFNNTTGEYLIAIGDSALFTTTGCSDTLGKFNIAIGSKSLFSNTCGFRNTAIGFRSMVNNTTGNENTAMGTYALQNNVDGSRNTAIGASALSGNTTGDDNTAVGRNALNYNTSGSGNTAVGHNSLQLNDTGNENTAIGSQALINAESQYNTAIGYQALNELNTAQYNTAVGWAAGNSYTLGWNNTLIGAGANVSASGQMNSIAIGEGAVTPEDNTARIGNSAIWSIGGYQDWTNVSDGRFKKNVRTNVVGLDFILRLRPVTYNLDVYRISDDTNERGGREPDQYLKESMDEKEKFVECGFIAQEVEQAAIESGYDFSGIDKPRNEHGVYGLRYATFVVPLTKAVQELSAENDLLKEQLVQRKAKLAEVSARINRLESRNR